MSQGFEVAGGVLFLALLCVFVAGILCLPELIACVGALS